MKQRASFVKRCLALALALVLLVSQANLGILQPVRAAESDASTTIAQGTLSEGSRVSVDTDLFAIIAENYGTEKVAEILKSGAVKGNETISYTIPAQSELDELVKLDDQTLTAQSISAEYAGLNWVPYSYVVDGKEYLFNGKTEVVIDEVFSKVDVYYRLTMTNYSTEKVEEVLGLVAELVAEADEQKLLMDTLASYKSDMSTLNKLVLIGANSMVDYFKTKYGETVVNDMKATINEIINNGFDENDVLKLNVIIDEYTDENNGGLFYYYQNSEYIKYEINFLREHLSAMLNEEDGHKDLLVELLNALSFGQYVEKLDGLKEKIADIDSRLAGTNSNIDTTDNGKLVTLVNALTMEGEVAAAQAGSPYVQMAPVTRNSERFVTVNVEITAGGKSYTASATVEKRQALTQAQVDALKAEIDTFVNDAINTAYYTSNYNNGAELDALVGVALTKGATYTYSWTPSEYTVKIAGADDQIVTVNNRTISLPAHSDAAKGMSYIYVIGSKTIEVSGKDVSFTFEESDLLNLFVDGALTITRLEKNIYAENLVKMVQNVNAAMGFEALALIGVEGVEDAYSGIEANIVASDLMNLMLALVQHSGYTYIGLNDEGLIYANENNELELSLQTLVNAICLDEEFDNERLIALGENGSGTLLKASMQLGKTSGIQFENLELVVNLTDVPEQLTTYVGYIKLISKYITFKGDNRAMAFEVTIPDQAYAVYAATLVASGNVDKQDVNELTQKVPVQFVYDYLTAITGSEMDMVTYGNTLEMLGINKDLAAYNEYYKTGMNVYNEHVVVSIDDDKTAVTVNAPVKTVVDILMNLMGVENQTLDLLLPLVAEYKHETEVAINVTGKLSNVDKTYYALVLDAQADGVTNKMEAPSSYASLAKETAELAGYSYIILTADVPGDLTIAGTTLLDLNGFNVEGTINATGKLFIIDTSLSTYDAGTVNNVTGNAVIIAGNYLSDISSKLKDGYYMEGTTVRHTLYTMKDVDGVMTFTLNGDFYEDENCSGYIPDVKALAVDIAADLLMNYYNTAMIGVDEYELVHMNFDDLVGLYADDDRVTELAKKLLSAFTVGEAGYENNAGFEGVVNLILADLLNFEQITEGLKNNSALATHTLVTAPWTIKIDHNTEGNYATLDVCANMDLKKECKFAIAIESKFNDNVAAMTEILAEIVVKDETYAMVDIPTPTYSDKTLTISGAGKTSMVMDMSADNKYAVAIAVVLAYGNPSKAEAVAAAVNANDMEALKVVVDNTSVKEIFTALKKMSRNVSFADMAAQVGVTVDTAAAADLEGRFHLVFCAAGKALEELDITGMDSKLGALYNEETGYYELTKGNIFRDKEFEVRGYSALIELEATELTLKVKLFDDGCLWGDANHDGIVDTFDATLVEMYAVGTAPEMFCTIRTDVNGDGSIDSMDATLIRMYTVGSITVFPAENK